MRIAVAVATCKRPLGLERLLRALGQLTPPQGAEMEVVVVDNDPRASGHGVVANSHHLMPFPLHYIHEPKRGVSQARNAALVTALEMDLIAFIDDDEIPAPDWLCSLVATWKQTGAAAVTGPVEPRFEAAVPGWFDAAFRRCYIRPKSGRPFDELTAANLLLDCRVLVEEGLAFDLSLGLTGGEDTKLAGDLVAAGRTLAWAPEAVVTECIPPSRTCLNWLLKRWYRTGNTEALLATMGARSPGAGRALSLFRGCLRIGAGGALVVMLTPLALIGRFEPVVQRLYTLARGLGMVGGALGSIHKEYQTVHGR